MLHLTSRGLSGATAVLAAVVLKVTLVFIVIPYLTPGSYSQAYVTEVFQDWHDYIPMNLVLRHGYRFFPETTETMLRTPGFVLVVAGIFSVFGHSVAAVKAFNVLFSFVTAVAIFVLGRQIVGSKRAGFIAAAIALFYPGALVADSRGGPESLLTLGIVLFVLFLYRALKTDRFKDYAIAGCALGMVLVIKSTAALFPFLLFLYLASFPINRSRLLNATKKVGVLSLTAALVLSPWIVRNYLLSGHLVPTMTVSGMAMFQNSYIVSHWNTGKEHYVLLDESAVEMNSIAQQMGLKFRPGYYPQFYNIEDEVKYYGHLGDLVKAYYAEDPSRLLKAALFHARGFWIQGRTAKATTLNTLLVLPFVALSLWGAYLGWQRRLVIMPLLLFAVAFFAAHVFIAGIARYHIPLVPLLAILVAIPLEAKSPLRRLSAILSRERKEAAT